MKTRRGRIQETSRPGGRPIAAPKLDPRVPGPAAGSRSHCRADVCVEGGPATGPYRRVLVGRWLIHDHRKLRGDSNTHDEGKTPIS